MRLVSETRITLPDPSHLARLLTEHLAEHEVLFETRGGSTVAQLGRGTGTLTVTEGGLTVRVEASDRGDLEMLRSVFASHIVEFADAPVAMQWTGAEDKAAFANFREVRLVGASDVTPHMRRLTFAGRGLARFASDADLHVRLYFPPIGIEIPEWPYPGPDGRTVWPADERRPAVRYYTIRHAHPGRDTIDIDFVMHPGGGPGATFAATAKRGDVIGMFGPIGRTVAPASSYLLAGDETALPAIARILETLPSDANGTVLLEADGPGDEIRLDAPAGMRVKWLHRNGAPAGLPDRLDPAVREVAFAPDKAPFVWIGCEFALAKTLRAYVETELGLSRDRHLIVGYWSRADR